MRGRDKIGDRDECFTVGIPTPYTRGVVVDESGYGTDRQTRNALRRRGGNKFAKKK